MMPGQPNLPVFLAFDVTELAITEPGPPFLDQNILDLGEPFALRVTFTMSGPFAFFIEGIPGIRAVMQFYAEGMGPGVPNVAFGTPTLGLTAGTGTYVYHHPVPGGVTAGGIYRCGVAVTFRVVAPPPGPAGDVPVPAILGFNEDCVIQVHHQETLP
jgi:hypothetical protein